MNLFVVIMNEIFCIKVLMKTTTKKVAPKTKQTKTSSAIVFPNMRTFKHEQALLVALAYVIGFTTAFIAFKLSDDTRLYDLSANTHNLARKDSQHFDVSIKHGDLLATKDGIDRVVSAKSDSLEVEDGFHSEILSASISPDGRFMHYCVVVDPESDSCANFVYSTMEDIIYRVKNQGEQVMSERSSVSSEGWGEDGKLMIAGRYSLSADKPWEIAD